MFAPGRVVIIIIVFVVSGLVLLVSSPQADLPLVVLLLPPPLPLLLGHQIVQPLQVLLGEQARGVVHQLPDYYQRKNLCKKRITYLVSQKNK